MRTLRFRLTLWFSLAVTLTAGTAAWIGHLLVKRQMLNGIDFLLDAEVQEIAARLGDHPERLGQAELQRVLASHTAIDAPLYFFQVHRLGHGVVFRSANLGDAALLDLSDGGALTRTVDLRGAPVRQIERHQGDLHVQVATSLEQFESLVGRFRHALLIGFPLLFAASLGAGLLVSTLALRPIRAMQRSARRISANNLSERLPVPAGGDEIADLARLLNDLFDRLQAAFEQVQRFTADASHELKTPLSLIRLHAERLLHSPALDRAAQSQVGSQLEEITRLNKLVESLLLLAKADAGGLRLERRRIDPAAYIGEFAEDAQTLAEDRGCRFETGLVEAGQATFDPGMVRNVFLNVLSNAVRHTPPGRCIRLDSRVRDGTWEVAFEDEGPGLPEAELQEIFGRFVRRPAAGENASEGSGLGLAIARSIVEAHGGTIHAENRPAGGLRVVVRLPGAARSAAGQPLGVV